MHRGNFCQLYMATLATLPLTLFHYFLENLGHSQSLRNNAVKGQYQICECICCANWSSVISCSYTCMGRYEFCTRRSVARSHKRLAGADKGFDLQRRTHSSSKQGPYMRCLHQERGPAIQHHNRRLQGVLSGLNGHLDEAVHDLHLDGFG